MAKVSKSVRLKWPVGPQYFRRSGGKNPHAWARLKITSAEWYLDALAATMREAGDLDRYVGIEMALDGALTSMCAAVDAAGSGLADKFARAARLPITESETSSSSARWRSVYSFASALGVTLPSEYAVSEAFAGFASSAPAGWFSQLELLRERAVRHNVLVRRTGIGGDTRGRFLDVPGVGPREPIEYLESVREKVNEIVEMLLADIDLIPKLLAPKADADRAQRPRQRALPDLLSRARVLTPSDGGELDSDEAASPAISLLRGSVIELVEQLDARRLSRFTRFHEQVLRRLGGQVSSSEWVLSEPSVAELVELAIERVPQVRMDDAVDLLAAIVADVVLSPPSPERIERHNTFLGFVSGLRDAHIRFLAALGEARAALDSSVRSHQTEGPDRASEGPTTRLPDLATMPDSIATELTGLGLVAPARENGMWVVDGSVGDPFSKRIEPTEYGRWIIEQLKGPIEVPDRRVFDRIASPKD